MANLDAHSRLIAWLKIALPLAALALLSTLFLVARTIDPEEALPYAQVDIEDRLREPRMTDPSYAGVTDDGAALTLSAAEARPDATDSASGTAQSVVGLLETPDGASTTLRAGAARIDGAQQHILLSSGVTITQSNGWQIETQEMIARMDQTEITSDTPVTATGPTGSLTADSMRLTEDAQRPGRYLVVFNSRVKLIYRPAN